MPMGMAMTGAKMDMLIMGITVDVPAFPAGEVAFQVINDSQEFYNSKDMTLVEVPDVALP